MYFACFAAENGLLARRAVVLFRATSFGCCSAPRAPFWTRFFLRCIVCFLVCLNHTRRPRVFRLFCLANRSTAACQLLACCSPAAHKPRQALPVSLPTACQPLASCSPACRHTACKLLTSAPQYMHRLMFMLHPHRQVHSQQHTNRTSRTPGAHQLLATRLPSALCASSARQPFDSRSTTAQQPFVTPRPARGGRRRRAWGPLPPVNMTVGSDEFFVDSLHLPRYR